MSVLGAEAGLTASICMGRGLVNLVGFRDFLKLLKSLLPECKKLPCRVSSVSLRSCLELQDGSCLWGKNCCTMGPSQGSFPSYCELPVPLERGTQMDTSQFLPRNSGAASIACCSDHV